MNIEDLVEVTLPEPDNFLKVRETLTRIGVASKQQNTLFQSCHILHKQGKYYIVHFKELFALDGKPTNFDDEDRGRRNTIANLLDDWSLVDLVDNDKSADPLAPLNRIKILAHRDKEDWELVPKYNIGKR